VHPDQQAVYDLMRERLFELFGPGGSFRITLGRPGADDAVFVSTVADTIAWDVAAALEPTAALEHDESAPGRRANPIDPEEAEYRRIWKHVEAELLRRRNDEDSLDLPAETQSAHRAA
jgi:hypothetical protein